MGKIIRTKNGKPATKARLRVLDESLAWHISNNPHNLTAVFNQVAKITNFKPITVKNRWYGYKANSNNAKGLRSQDAIFAIMTKEGIQFNRKNAGVMKQTRKVLNLNTSLTKVEDLTTEHKIEFFNMMFKQ